MTTVISGTSGVTFPAGGLGNPAGAVVGTSDTQTLTNKTLTSATLTTPTITGSVANLNLTTPNIDSAQIVTVSGTAPLYMARAWVNFNGTGTVAIRASGNVSSITDNGTGSYAINFTTAMTDTNYACVMATKGSSGAGTPLLPLEHASLTARTTSRIDFYVIALNGATPDADVVEVAVFR